MGTHILGNILQIRCMVLESISLEMDIGMKEHGMREGGKGLVCTLSEMEKHNLVTGKMGFLMFLLQRMATLDLQRLLVIPKFVVLSR
jgi:hypothetical protein